MIMAPIMDNRALMTLAQWFSPAYPVGAFAYSLGLEWAFDAGDVSHADALERWILAWLRAGAGRSDAILLSLAYEADENVNALALQPSAERRLESRAQGAAFARTTASVSPEAPDAAGEIAFPVAVGRAAKAVNAPLDAALRLYLQTFAGGLVSAGVRLIPIGQTEGQRVLAALAPLIDALAEEAARAGPDEIGGAALRADIASMRHETQETGLFRS